MARLLTSLLVSPLAGLGCSSKSEAPPPTTSDPSQPVAGAAAEAAPPVQTGSSAVADNRLAKPAEIAKKWQPDAALVGILATAGEGPAAATLTYTY